LRSCSRSEQIQKRQWLLVSPASAASPVGRPLLFNGTMRLFRLAAARSWSRSAAFSPSPVGCAAGNYYSRSEQIQQRRVLGGICDW
ncbi:hypothetical protein HAX54_012764, partial [Datura stramonium]|nr:hypothetical protein [Datura stramonium]